MRIDIPPRRSTAIALLVSAAVAVILFIIVSAILTNGSGGTDSPIIDQAPGDNAVDESQAGQ